MTHENSTYARRIRFIKYLFGAMLLATLVAEKFMHAHGYFGIDQTPFFYAWFGFSSCLMIIFISKFLGLFLKRSDRYYDEDDA